MAAIRNKSTKYLILTLVLLNITQIRTEDDTIFDMSEEAEHLLRGGSDRRIDEIIDQTTSETKAIESTDTTTEGVEDKTEIDDLGLNFDDPMFTVTDEGDEKMKTTESDEEFSSTTEVSETSGFDEDGSGESTTKDYKLETLTTAAPELTDRIADDDAEPARQRNPKTDDASNIQEVTQKRNLDIKPLQARSDSKAAILRNWFEDPYLRSPAGLLVPLRPVALKRALAVWEDLVKEGLNITDIVVIGYDSNGINWRSRHNLKGAPTSYQAISNALSKLIVKYQDTYQNEVIDDGTMRALGSAAKSVPYDSAIFVVTDKAPADSQRLPLALRALVEKRLKVYTIWTDPRHPTPNSEDSLHELKNISAHTEGNVLHYSLEDVEGDSSTSSETEWESVELPKARNARVNSLMDDKMETLLIRRGDGAAISLGIPVESSVSGLRVHIEGEVEHAVLYPPNDAPQIDLMNLTSVRNFSRSSRTNSLSPRDVYLIFPGAETQGDGLSVLPMEDPKEEKTEPYTGTWHLSVTCDKCDYRLTVSAYALIGFEAGLLDKDTVSLHVTGPITTVREAMLVDEYGNELGKLLYSYQPTPIIGTDPRITSPNDLKADVPFPKVKADKVYVKIVGRDVRGESYTRLSGPLTLQKEARTSRAAVAFPDTNELEVSERSNQRLYDARFRYNDTSFLADSRATSQVINQRGTILSAVQIGLSTRLYGAPGDILQLHFEVSNYREQSVYYRFEAVGELRFLTGISPAAQTVASGQTVNVIVTARIGTSAQPGARDLITFTAYGLDQISISTYVYVTNPDSQVTDVWSPTLYHTFQGTCLGRTGDDCAQHTWSARVIARDAVGGLLRLTSTPVGITYDSNFVAGTREEVSATYRANCCSPRAVVTAVDAYGNANSYVMDISNYIAPAGIAAIVLGVFLFIALIILVAFLIYWCVKRRKESQELPYVTSRREVN